MTEAPQQDGVNTAHLRDYSQLRRSASDRKIAGVAGGLGRHLNIDPTVLRVAFVVLAFFGGAGLLLYGVLWLFVPDERTGEAVIKATAATRNGVIIVAAVLAGLILVGDSWGGFGFPWPIFVAALILFFVLTNRDKAMSSEHPSSTPVAPGGPTGQGESTYDAPRTEGSGSHDAGAYDTGSVDTGPHDTARYESVSSYDETSSTTGPPYSGAVPPAPSTYPPSPPPAPQPYRGPRLFWFTIALLAVALGSLGLYDVAQGGVADAAYPALALTVVGAMLVVGAWFGRPGGLILLGVVATLVLVATSVTEPRFVGDRSVRETPASAVQVDDRYFVPAGEIILDMSDVRDIARLDGRTIELEANAGHLVVVLPDGVDAQVDAHVAGAGEIQVPGQTRAGVGGLSVDRTVDGGQGAPEIDLNLDLVVGSIEVRQ